MGQKNLVTEIRGSSHKNQFFCISPCYEMCSKTLGWWWIVFAEWLTNERPLALFSAMATVRDSYHHKFLLPVIMIWTCAETVFRLWWMKLCSSDNRYPTALWYLGIWVDGIWVFQFSPIGYALLRFPMLLEIDEKTHAITHPNLVIKHTTKWESIWKEPLIFREKYGYQFPRLSP